jgi:hypothetical protein
MAAAGGLASAPDQLHLINHTLAEDDQSRPEEVPAGDVHTLRRIQVRKTRPSTLDVSRLARAGRSVRRGQDCASSCIFSHLART